MGSGAEWPFGWKGGAGRDRLRRSAERGFPPWSYGPGSFHRASSGLPPPHAGMILLVPTSIARRTEEPECSAQTSAPSLSAHPPWVPTGAGGDSGFQVDSDSGDGNQHRQGVICSFSDRSGGASRRIGSGDATDRDNPCDRSGGSQCDGSGWVDATDWEAHASLGGAKCRRDARGGRVAWRRGYGIATDWETQSFFAPPPLTDQALSDAACRVPAPTLRRIGRWQADSDCDGLGGELPPFESPWSDATNRKLVVS